MGKLSNLFETSFIKTLHFNFHYFGWRGGTASRADCEELRFE